MTPKPDIKAGIEKEILKEMQPKGLKYMAIEYALATVLNGTWACSLGGGWTYLFAGMAALSLPGIYNAIAGVKAASRNAKRIVSALNNEERGTLGMLLHEERVKYDGLLDKEPKRGILWDSNTEKSAWYEKPLEEQLTDIAEEANLLFGYEGIILPKIERSTETGTDAANYNPSIKLIRVSESKKASACTIAHEYVHHIGNIKKRILQWSPFLGEGLAEAAGASAAESYGLRAGDWVIETESHLARISCLRDYIEGFDCRHLLEIEGSRDMVFYTVAPTAFLVAERKHGKGIYKQVLESKKPMELLADMVCGSVEHV
ncbi:MAG TPA: hypothetical protein HA362_07735 [Nanoarchaeota archaeon]|nr:hypothetical protein [Nanoarchaeota archaeon]